MLDQILVMLHPFMPFVTEELWHSMGARECELIVAKWPEPGAGVNAEAKGEIEWLVRVVSAIRSARTQINVPPGIRMSAFVEEGDDAFQAMLRDNLHLINRLARTEVHKLGNAGPDGRSFFQVVVDEQTYRLQLDGAIDIAAEKARLAKALEASTKEAKSLAARLANPAFVEKAKPEAIAKARADHDHHAAEAERLAAALARLG